MRIALPVAALLLAACAARETATLPRLTPEAERIFHADPRWLGGDAAISVDLGNERILWLFGDSFVDPEPPYARREAAFIRNSIAVQTGRDPRRVAMAFQWRSGADGAPASFFPETGGDWYWPGGGAMLGEGTLALFLHRLRQTDAAPPLGFESAGYALALIANPGDPPGRWRGRIVPGPTLPFDALPGAAVLAEGGTLLVLATATKGAPAGYMVRYAAADLAQGELSRGLWWSGAGWRPAAALGANGPAAIIADTAPESSLQTTPCGLLHVASRGFGGTDIVARRAPAPEGPWGAPAPLLRPPESDGPAPFVYAGRAHPALEAPQGEIVLSYVANSFTPEALLEPPGATALYWPRLARAAAPPCP